MTKREAMRLKKMQRRKDRRKSGKFVDVEVGYVPTVKCENYVRDLKKREEGKNEKR